MTLSNAVANKTYEIIDVMAEENVRKYLANIGVLPKQKIFLFNISKGNAIIKVGECRLALNKELASQIYINEI